VARYQGRSEQGVRASLDIVFTILLMHGTEAVFSLKSSYTSHQSVNMQTTTR
jgi:hypothetical protein